MKDLTKKKTWRCQKYLDWVKSQPSCISGLPADDAHHVKGHGFGGSIKAPDWAVIPLTREEHMNFHNSTIQSWERAHGHQLALVARTLGKAIEEGIIKIKDYEP